MQQAIWVVGVDFLSVSWTKLAKCCLSSCTLLQDSFKRFPTRYHPEPRGIVAFFFSIMCCIQVEVGETWRNCLLICWWYPHKFGFDFISAPIPIYELECGLSRVSWNHCNPRCWKSQIPSDIFGRFPQPLTSPRISTGSSLAAPVLLLHCTSSPPRRTRGSHRSRGESASRFGRPAIFRNCWVKIRTVQRKIWHSCLLCFL